MAALADEFDSQQRLVELELINNRLQRQLASAKAKSEALVSAVYQAAKDAAVVVGTPVSIPSPKKDKRKHPEACLIHLTDWQLGKKTEDYDTQIAISRVKEAVRKSIKLTEIQRADHPVTAAHLMLGGDLVENVAIFPGQVYEVDSTSFDQIFQASALVESAILSLLENFESVHVWEVAGNHGRIGKKGDYPRKDNLDRIVGKIARDRLSSQTRLHWEEPTTWYQIVEIGNYRALLHHGDSIKLFGGNIPAFGILRKSIAWSSGVLPPFTDAYLGHFHQAMTLSLPGNEGGRVFVTPSTESGSEYAREFVAAKGHPAQRCHFIDPRRGRITAEHLLYLDDMQKEE